MINKCNNNSIPFNLFTIYNKYFYPNDDVSSYKIKSQYNKVKVN
jgi:hypothetical protein